MHVPYTRVWIMSVAKQTVGLCLSYHGLEKCELRIKPGQTKKLPL